jgi:pre-rRNA-processing protein TSR2
MVDCVINFLKMSCLKFFFLDDVLAQEITEYMEDLMNNEFNTLCEDGSLEEMGESLCKYFRLIKDGKDAEVILELQKYKGSSVHLCKTASNHDESTLQEEKDEDPDNQTVETPKKSTKNEPDEDGWVTVTKGKKH